MTTRRLLKRVDLELAGVSNLDGGLDRPLASGVLFVPDEVTLEGENLVWWDEREITKPLETRTPSLTLFEDFVNLADAPPGSVRDYARRFGVLGICVRHGLPQTHEINGASFCYTSVEGRTRGSKEYWAGWEPLAAWKKFAASARAMLAVAATLHEGMAVRNEGLWTAAGLKGIPKRSSCDEQKFTLSLTVNDWLNWGAVRPIFAWEEGKPATVTLGPPIPIKQPFKTLQMASRVAAYCQGISLFSVLATQLLMAVSSTSGFAICSGCGKAFLPNRRPNPLQHRYCTRCGKRAAWRDAQQRRRAKKREPGTSNAGTEE